MKNIIYSFLLSSIFITSAASQEYSDAEIGSLVLSGHCETLIDSKELEDTIKFFTHYSNLHDTIGIQCNHDNSIEISNDVDFFLEGLQSFEDACRYNQEQLERVYIEYGMDLGDSKIAENPIFHRTMGIFLYEKPKNIENYTKHDFDGTTYLLNEENIKCSEMNLDIIEDLIELGVTGEEQIHIN